MNALPRRRRRALCVLFGGMGLAAVILSFPLLRGGLIAPLTTAVWLLLRVLVLPVHQGVWWAALICIAPFMLFLTFCRRARLLQSPEPTTWAAGDHPLERWRRVMEEEVNELAPLPIIGWGPFVELVVSLSALERRVSPDYRLHEALRIGEVPLPSEVHPFLFPPPRRKAQGLVGWVRFWVTAPGRLARRLSGADRADRHRSVSDVLCFLERSLEMTRNDDDDRVHS